MNTQREREFAAKVAVPHGANMTVIKRTLAHVAREAGMTSASAENIASLRLSNDPPPPPHESTWLATWNVRQERDGSWVVVP